MVQEFSIIIDGQEIYVPEEKATKIVETLKDVSNCYAQDSLGYAVNPVEEYDNDIIQELASMLGADLNELDEDGRKAWMDCDKYFS